MNCSAVGLHCVKIKTDFDFLRVLLSHLYPFFFPLPPMFYIFFPLKETLSD